MTMTLIKHLCLFASFILTISSNHSIKTSSFNGDNAFPLPDIQVPLKQLATNRHQPNAWRRLGKLQLDAGEFAEARRIFCHGSECCPDDEALKHHVKVFKAFHSDSSEDIGVNMNDDDTPPPLQSPDNLNDLFLSLHIPPKNIPRSILQHPSSSTILPPNQKTRLIHASTKPILPKQTCDYLIQKAIQKTNDIGWTTNRHVQAPTCDVPVFDLDKNVQNWICRAFHNVLFPMLCSLVQPELTIKPDLLRVQDCFIVRYDAPSSSEQKPGFASLKPHQDESLLSLTIALNDADNDYNDGGLYIASTQDVLNGPAGTVLCFAGGLVHGGYPVTSGTRWILTVFLYVDENQSGRNVGYTLKALEKEILALRGEEKKKEADSDK